MNANAQCPRCGSAFPCGSKDIQACACSGLQLDAALLRVMRDQYSTCLCISCLKQLQAEPAKADRDAA